MAKWKKLSVHVLGIIAITLVSLCAISQAKQLASTHKWMLVITLLIGASFIFESLLTVRRRLVNYYKAFSVLTGLCMLSVVALDASINTYVYFLAVVSLCLFAVKAAHVQFVMHSFELSPASSRYQLDLNCSIKDGLANQHINAKIIDISNTGCLIDCDQSLNPGAVVYLNILLKTREVRTSARVIRQSNKNGYGMQFVGLDRRKYNTFDDALKDILIDSGTIPFAA
ncbi:MAG: PilZ domain-containing protein [Bdellovibrionales bacterium]|nr:PilZ domain-containing protein [Bdellovibrionales bacterium]